MTDAEPAPWQLARLLDGFVTTQLLYVAAKLDLAAVLADGPLAVTEIANTVDADASVLRRVLRGLAAEGVLTEHDEGTFGLTALGAALVPLRGAALARGEVYYESAAGLLDSVRHGGVPFEEVNGAPFFDHLGAHPEQEAAFHASMAGRAEQEAADVVAAYDFSAFTRLVDVGGGRGVLLAAILRAASTLHAVLLDRPAAIPAATAHLEAAGVGPRAQCVAGDFFVSVPPGAGAYVLSRVVHDWDDEAAARILATCRAAMAPESHLLVVDAILPERARDNPAAIRMDLHMLLLLGARERTEREFRNLLDGAGFRVERVCPTKSPAGLAVIDAVLA